ncbi:MAG: hypothetical protein ABI854_02635 [Betaproteobacteria bacterium]
MIDPLDNSVELDARINMLKLTTVALPAIITVAAIQAALAQSASDSIRSRPNPLDATVSVPAVVYQSSFEGYRPLSEEKVGSWRTANDEVGRIGGWRAYAREGRNADAAVAGPAVKAPGAPADKPAESDTAKRVPDGHSGHQMK